MANKRQFKKELSLILELVIEECVFTAEFDEKKLSEIEDLANDAIAEFNFAYSARKTDKSISYKAFYSALKEQYYQKMLNILEKVSSIRKA
ncbi:MAG: hypothetical protein LBU90_08325 [Bacteroidales bacterium]|jgi:hypothetical protein|nr:hypothetical protein [Bacteroidales bacterium]